MLTKEQIQADAVERAWLAPLAKHLAIDLDAEHAPVNALRNLARHYDAHGWPAVIAGRPAPSGSLTAQARATASAITAKRSGGDLGDQVVAVLRERRGRR